MQCRDVLDLIRLFVRDPSWRGRILIFLDQLMKMCTCFNMETYDPSVWLDSSFQPLLGNRRVFFEFLETFQEQVLLEITSHYLFKDSEKQSVVEILFAQYTKSLCARSCEIFCSLEIDNFFCTLTMEKLQSSLVGVLLLPLLHTLCLCTSHLSLCHQLLPSIVHLLKKVTEYNNKSNHYLELGLYISHLFVSSRLSSSMGSFSERDWNVLKAGFEQSDASYLISDGGSMYSAVQSNNTCAVVPIGFSAPMRAAWEFLLVGDSVNDECSVFGAARMPLSSRSVTT